MNRADRLLILALALLALVSWPLAALAASGQGDVVVISGPQGETAVSLVDDADLEVAGARGIVTVRIADGRACVLESGCPDQICVKTGTIASGGAVVACVPNGVVLRVGGGDDGGFDARVR